MPGLSSSNSSALLPCAIGTIIFWICATSVLLVQKDRSSYLPDWAMSMSMSDYSDRRPESNKSHSLGGVAVLTPTYNHATRFADLVHVSATLQVAQSYGVDIFWVVSEDVETQDPVVLDLLKDSNLRFEYLTLNASLRPDRQFYQRNGGLEAVAKSGFNGAVYMTDDDNSIRPELLRELVRLPPLSFTLFQVGNIGRFGSEGPLFFKLDDDDDGRRPRARLEQWLCSWCPRRWNIDMGGFAFSADLLRLDSPPHFPKKPSVASGFLENDFLESIEATGQAELVVLPELLDRVYAFHDHSVPWHTNATYDPTWSVARLRHRRLKDGTGRANEAVCAKRPSLDACNFEWAALDLPLARIVT